MNIWSRSEFEDNKSYLSRLRLSDFNVTTSYYISDQVTSINQNELLRIHNFYSMPDDF